ncbi:uncharacterized protein LOC133782971 [Humulus lupulus]|uniref:uncharacterized protein LOC133782971 n=1 Tax=Humulus lupulus TaxID=3486 RepID=UPI002B40FED9|nr:uncharacterized protein LOC133782971 [Humulus lupulus]
MKIKYLVWLFFMILCMAASSCKSDNQQDKQLKYENGVLSPDRENREIEHGKKLGLEESEDGHKLSSIRKAKAVYGGANDLTKKPKNSQSAPKSLLLSFKQLIVGFIVCTIVFFPF